MKAVCILPLLLAIALAAAEAPKEKANELPAVVALCNDWLAKHDDAKARDHWTDKLAKRLADWMAQNEATLQRAADTVLTEYLRSIDKELDEAAPEKLKPINRVLICRWIVFYAGRDLSFDKDVRDVLTVKNFKRWIEHNGAGNALESAEAR